jgi:hypothetical protein
VHASAFAFRISGSAIGAWSKIEAAEEVKLEDEEKGRGQFQFDK